MPYRLPDDIATLRTSARLDALREILAGAPIKSTCARHSRPGLWRVKPQEMREALDLLGMRRPYRPLERPAEQLTRQRILEVGAMLAGETPMHVIRQRTGLDEETVRDCGVLSDLVYWSRQPVSPTEACRRAGVTRQRAKKLTPLLGLEFDWSPRRKGISKRLPLGDRIACLAELGWSDREIAKALRLRKWQVVGHRGQPDHSTVGAASRPIRLRYNAQTGQFTPKG